MTSINININDNIKVRLTEHGLRIHFDHYHKYLGDKFPISNCLPDRDEKGYTKYQLWEFANIFGEHLFNGADQVIKDNEVIIV